MNRLFPLFRPIRWPRGLLLGLICALFIAGLTSIGGLDSLEGRGLDLLFQARGPRFPDPRITILVADDATVSHVGRWPLPRHLYADAVRRLSKAGAHTIAFDILFSVPSSVTTSDDADLVRACDDSKRVVQAAVFHVPQIYNPALPANLTSDKRTPPARFGVSNFGAQCLTATWVSSALPELQKSAPAMGHVNVYPETDGTLRRVPLIRYRKQIYPSLAMVSAAHFLGLAPRDIRAEKDEVRLIPAEGPVRRIALDSKGEALVNWIGGNDSFPTYNFNQLMEGRIPPIALKDRLVLIGITAAGAFEGRATPFSPVQPAIELQANVVDDILSNRSLEEASSGARLALLLASAVLAGLLVAPRSALGGVLWVTALNTVLWKGAVWSMDAHNIYVPIIAPMLAVVLVYGAATAFNYRREWEANWRVDAAVTALARGGALMASGRDRAALMSVIQRTAREVLQAREVFLVLEEELPLTDAGDSLAAASHSSTQLSTLSEAAQQVSKMGQPVLWSDRARWLGLRQQSDRKVRASAQNNESPEKVAEVTLAAPTPALEKLLSRLNNEIKEHEVKDAHGRHRASSARTFQSILAAPLPHGTEETDSFTDDAGNPNGVLLAAGRSDGQPFTSRDAILLATLADQAALALGNLEYYEMLRGRIDLANRDLRHAYQTLAEERTKLAAAMESSESTLIISDEANRAIFINTASAAILPNAALGQPVPHALVEQGLDEFARLFEALEQSEPPALKAVAESTRLLERGPKNDPVRHILNAQLTALTSHEGSRLGTMLVITDVTTQRDLGQMKDDFVSYVAHELRSPLSAINGYAFLLKSDGLDFPEQQRLDMLVSIQDQCNRLNRMVNDLLDITGIEAVQEVQLNCTEIDLAALCEKVIEDQRATISNGEEIQLSFHCNDCPIAINADADRMEQVLINLVSNAIKYSPDGGTVTVSLSRSAPQQVVLRVVDTGMGMTGEQLTRLFEKYYRTPDAQMRGIRGTGLGLHLVKRLVEAHGGRIEVESDYKRGSTFTVTLPLDSGE